MLLPNPASGLAQTRDLTPLLTPKRRLALLCEQRIESCKLREPRKGPPRSSCSCVTILSIAECSTLLLTLSEIALGQISGQYTWREVIARR